MSCRHLSFEFRQSLETELRLGTRNPAILISERDWDIIPSDGYPEANWAEQPTQGKAGDSSLLRTDTSSSGAHPFSCLIENLFALMILKSQMEKCLTKHADQRIEKGLPTHVSHWWVKATQFILRKNKYLIILLGNRFSRQRERAKCD